VSIVEQNAAVACGTPQARLRGTLNMWNTGQLSKQGALAVKSADEKSSFGRYVQTVCATLVVTFTKAWHSRSSQAMGSAISTEYVTAGRTRIPHNITHSYTSLATSLPFLRPHLPCRETDLLAIKTSVFASISVSIIASQPRVAIAAPRHPSGM